MNKQTLKTVVRHLVPNAGTIIVVALMLFVYRAGAAPSAAPASPDVAPEDISYQGTLTNAAGKPVDGKTDITFRLYTVPTGGTALWTEAHTGSSNAVPVNNGLFNVMLGSLTPIPSTVWGNSALYLGVQVGSDAEMTPREVVGAVPVAMTLANASSLVKSVVSNTELQYGTLTATASEQTNTLSAEIDFNPDFTNRPILILQAAYNYTPYVIVTYGLPCDGTKCTAFIRRTDGGTWAIGQTASVDWVALRQR